MKIEQKEFYLNDNRVVLTLDAGGTNLVFSAIQGGSEIVKPITLPCTPNDLDALLNQLERGFQSVIDVVDADIYAISFAFPGPSNYKMGIIGDLPNFPAFRGGVALGPFLEEKFKLPVFINNDTNLYALGEYVFGFLPEVNQTIKEKGGSKQYNNLIGITLGTGFGSGIICDGHLTLGDNSNSGEIWLMRNYVFSDLCCDA
jgi:glucokinase